MSYAKSIMFLGTGSDVGKSILAAALCRVLRQDGYRVAPFKAQNMALNSYVTAEGGEMGRAQVVQAEAAGIEPHVDMNPILLKPTSHIGSQVVVRGRPIGTMTAQEYYRRKREFLPIILESYARLASAHDVIVVEGAGSAVELNLKEHDIVNLSIAKRVGASCILVGDIDRGGIFASLLGSLMLMEPDERALISGMIVNKFRGDPTLFTRGVDILEARSGKPVFGVVPYFSHITIHEEDSVALGRQMRERHREMVRGCQEATLGGDSALHIGVCKLPYISNYTDFDSFAQEPSVVLSYFDRPEEVFTFDAIILPGSKNTLGDLAVLHERGIVDALKSFVKTGRILVGICGGYQMLGQWVQDGEGVESTLHEVEGFGLLPMGTAMFPEKITYQVEAVVNDRHPLWRNRSLHDHRVSGYEIHMGRSVMLSDDVEPLFTITKRIGGGGGVHRDGMANASGNVWGTYLHGIFDNNWFRRWFLEEVARTRGKNPLKDVLTFSFSQWKERQYDLLADHFRQHVAVDKLYHSVGLHP